MLLSSQYAIGVRYGIAKDIAIANGQRHWATDWVLKQYLCMCRSKRARNQFLKNARRWCKNARQGVCGRREGVFIAENVDAADPAASMQGLYERHRSGQGAGDRRVKVSRRRRGAGA